MHSKLSLSVVWRQLYLSFWNNVSDLDNVLWNFTFTNDHSDGNAIFLTVLDLRQKLWVDTIWLLCLNTEQIIHPSAINKVIWKETFDYDVINKSSQTKLFCLNFYYMHVVKKTKQTRKLGSKLNVCSQQYHLLSTGQKNSNIHVFKHIACCFFSAQHRE